MMPRREDDKEFIQAMKGSTARRGLSEMKVRLALVQAAATMALEGTNRATASQVTERAISDYGIEATPSFTGQVFSEYGIGTAITHGKSRFVLEHEPLDEIRKGIAAKCEELAATLEKSLAEFKDLPQRIEAMEKQWKNLMQLKTRERELTRVINEDRKSPSRLPSLEAEAKKIRDEAANVEKLEAECQELTRKVKQLPSLEERKKSLEESLRKYQAEEKALVGREQQLSAREAELSRTLQRIREREGWLTLATIEQKIAEGKQELEQLSRQIGEKRSFMERLLHRRKEGGQ